jgi:hypothetical protein
LRKKRDELWKRFCSLPRKESFSGLYISGELEKVQQELDRLEGSKPSKRYRMVINIEIGG